MSTMFMFNIIFALCGSCVILVDALECPMSDRGDVIADKIVIDVHDCTNHPEGNEQCTTLRKNMVLNKDKMVNINHDVNDYAVMVQFQGEELCVSLRRKKINETSFRCRSSCENMFDVEDKGEVIAPYEEYLNSDGKDVKYKYMKFLNVTNFNETDTNSAGYMTYQSHPLIFSMIMVFIGMTMKLLSE